MWKDESKNLLSNYLFQAMLWIAIACALMLFMPQSMLKAFKLTLLIEQSAHIIGMFFILSVTYLTIDFCSGLLNRLKLKQRQHQMEEQIQDRIKTLTSGERAVLREFYLQRQTSLWLPSKECDVKSLLTSGVLMAVDYYATSRANVTGGTEIELMISHVARQHLTKSRLKLPVGKPNGEDISYLKLARPSYLMPVSDLKRTA